MTHPPTYDELAALRVTATHAAQQAAAQLAERDDLVARGASPVVVKGASLALQRAQLSAAQAASALGAALATTIGTLEPDVPLLLLPVRLETRFRPRGTGVDLLIRVYPDDIHLDSHEPGLVASEVEAGQRYWRGLWSATTDDDRAAAWRQLAGRVGPARAAWVARQLTPTNAPGAEPVFPTPAQQGSRWTRAAYAEALPEQWVAVAYRDGARIAESRGGLISRPLAASPSPVDSPGLTDAAMQWMVDFAAAQNAGMGLVMSLPQGQADRIDLLVVTGVRATTAAADAPAELAALLDAHRHTWGLDLVPVGTPTNNTSAVRAGSLVEPPFVDGSAVPLAGSDAELLGAALGLAAESPLATVAHAAASDQRDAADMATVLWPGTWGYYLTQIMRPLFGEVALDEWRRWVIGTVRGRGPLPMVRVGEQPYGVLPVTSLDRWRPVPDEPELLVLRTVASGGSQHSALTVLWDVDHVGGWHDAAAPMVLAEPAWGAGLKGPFVGAGLAAADLDGDGQVELVVGWLTADRTRAGYSVLRLGEEGQVTAELAQAEIPLDSPASALAIALAGTDLVVVAQHEVLGRRWLTRRAEASLRIGRSVAVDAPVSQWTDPVSFDGLTSGERLLGVAAADVDGDGQLELAVVVDAAGSVRYRVGAGALDGRLSWGPPVEVTAGGVASTAGGILFADVDHDGALEAVVHYAWDGGGVAAGAYRVGDDLDGSGQPGRWLGTYNTGSAAAGQPVGGGLAWAAIGRAPRVGWADTAGRVGVLQRLRAQWRLAVDDVPRVGGTDRDQDLLDLLATDAVTASVAVRPAIGPRLAHSLWFALNNPLAASYESDVEQRLAPFLSYLAFDGSPRLASITYGQEVESSDVYLGLDKPTDYLREMAAATPQQLHDQWVGPRVPLLARLVRHCLLQAYADAAWQLVPVPTDPPPPIADPELVDLADITQPEPVTPHTLTMWRHLAGASYQGTPVATFLHKAARDPQPPPAALALAEVIAAVRRLAALPIEVLHRLLMETLDLATHRLDAWLTAVATQRLRDLRGRRPTGLHLGGYGLVTDLRPAAGPPSTGYVHAPSINHAATAAVLRSGYLSHNSAALAVDLTSTRARLALELLDGVRSGQPLGALLGYRLERELAERGLSAQLPLLRQLAPEVVGLVTPAPPGAAVETVSALSTVDGIALLRQWREGVIPWGAAVPGQSGTLPGVGTSEQRAIEVALAAMQDAVDAVADVGVAESVHQTLQGNHLRAGGSLDALARGEVPPPDPDVLRSPRTGVALTHRLVLLLDPPKQVPAITAWRGADGPRARAEPRLNAWAAAVLGDPARVRWRVGFVDPAAGEPTGHAEREFTLAEVDLSPLDILYGPPPSVASLTETDLGRRLIRAAAVAASEYYPVPVPVLRPERAKGWGAEVLTLPELLTLAEVAREFVGGARAATAQDLAPAGIPVAAGVFDTEAADRAQAALDRLTGAVDVLREPFALTPREPAQLREQLSAPDVTDDLTSLLDLPVHVDFAAACRLSQRPSPDRLDSLRDGLDLLAAFGIDGAGPRSAAGADEAAILDLATQVRDAVRTVARRLAEVAAATDPVARLEAVFGPGFRVVPLFAPANEADLADGLTRRAAAGDATAWDVEDWFAGVARVRAGARRLEDVRLVGRAVGGLEAGAGPAGFTALQLPPRKGDRWLAAPLAPGMRMPGGLTGITVATEGWQPKGEQAGLVVDEWVEVVPNDEETTGLVFHYDAPGASAPQALLLAVSPDPSRPWDQATLEAVVLETVDATRIRAVQPHHVKRVGHLTPALFLARNAGGDPAGDTIATSFVD